MPSGTPQFAVPCPTRSSRSPPDVAGVVCQPDKPQGRGLELAARREAARPSWASPSSPRSSGRASSPPGSASSDVALVVAYGRILPKDVLEAPRLGCVNVHASLLPEVLRRCADHLGDRARRA
ncbi:MAG: hypothetical protein KF850_04935 [Labilithrix sp.]|nr:hypothetical protein [Labilithrix sp.]